VSEEQLWEYLETIEGKNKLLEIINSNIEEIEKLTAESTKWESKFYDEAKKVDKAIEYINWVWNNTNKPTNTIVALRTLENILQGSDKE